MSWEIVSNSHSNYGKCQIEKNVSKSKETVMQSIKYKSRETVKEKIAFKSWDSVQLVVIKPWETVKKITTEPKGQN
jgi:hypothetical protein